MGMPNHEPSDTSRPVLTATAVGVRLGVSASQVGGIRQLSCSPPLPWSPPWWAGAAAGEDGPLWILDPLGVLQGPPARARPATVIVIAAAAWGIAITAPGAITGLLPAPPGQRPPPGLRAPSAWWEPCGFADGDAGVRILAEAVSQRLGGGMQVAS
jgi:hypothetical protein